MLRVIALSILSVLGAMPLKGAAISPEKVVVLYNTAAPDSKKLAEFYRDARAIPNGNLIGLDMPVTPDISRADYETKILKPLRGEFDSRGWWSRQKDAQGVLLPTSNDMRVLVVIRGVPLRIQPAPLPEGKKVAPNDMIGGRNEASVDSELAMFGLETLPAEGVLKNAYYESMRPIADARLPFLILTARIDAASTATCERMITDALAAEKNGLWGRAYVDIANKFPQGDQWLAGIVKENLAYGIPTVVDRFNDTLPMNYPMTDAAEYYGWYDAHLSGPFLNPAFKFRPGAVAMHLHSFSAEQLTNPAANWSAGLLEKGAAVTVGNVYEPYLHLSHNFGMIQNRLLEGHTWVEACWMSIPVASWQAVVLGDPLYRPFLRIDGTGDVLPQDKEYRAIRAAKIQWPGDDRERMRQLSAAAERMGSGVLAEVVGLESLEAERREEAAIWFRNAQKHYKGQQDKLRQDFNLISLERAAGRKEVAIRMLRDAAGHYAEIPESQGLKGWIDILDPPAPPPATPTQ